VRVEGKIKVLGYGKDIVEKYNILLFFGFKW